MSAFFASARKRLSGAAMQSSSSGKGTAAGGSVENQSIMARLRAEISLAVLPAQNLPSVMKRRTDAMAAEVQVGVGSALIMTVRLMQWYAPVPQTFRFVECHI
jgi:hypothetical protein